ncbi:Tautomerase/MIF [Auricularia subglabra TFB-10046 SS5]|nr:Tautomerase/MIF [Auricularia subglabra TFB-10046 SS5]
MPYLSLVSNVKPADLLGFVKDLSELASKTLEKPEKFMAIDYRYNEHLSFAGTFEPAFILSIGSLINVNPETNDQFSGIFFAFLKEKLGVPGNRGFIAFSDPGPAYIGHDGTTMAKIFDKLGVKY